MKLILVGDIHGFFGPLAKIVAEAAWDDIIVQIGDFGFWPEFEAWWWQQKIDRPVHFIEGNHDCIPDLIKITKIQETWPNLYYIPRGTVLQLGSKRIAFCGGASSVDFKSRTLGKDWFAEEVVGQKDIELFLAGGEPIAKPDLLVTHSPPLSLIRQNFDRAGLRQFGLDDDWLDYSAAAIDTLWAILGHPDIITGHMHKSVQWNNARVLDIYEAYSIEI